MPSHLRSRAITPYQLPSSNTGADSVDRQSASEFDHAIQYLRKIKARYADDPDIYKQFLEILQVYQKAQRHIQDVSISP